MMRTDHESSNTVLNSPGLHIKYRAQAHRRTDRDPRAPSAKKQRRIYRTRPDPLAGVWDDEIVPML
jgi:hypothetical protein